MHIAAVLKYTHVNKNGMESGARDRKFMGPTSTLAFLANALDYLKRFAFGRLLFILVAAGQESSGPSDSALINSRLRGGFGGLSFQQAHHLDLPRLPL
jgi:hypothetical protein